MKLNNFEISVIKYIIEHEAPELMVYLSRMDVDSRIHNRSGFYVNIKYKESFLKESKKDITIGKNFYCDIDGINFGVGFILFVDGGIISSLEVFSHGGEEIPEEITKFELSYI